jgi:hypothetical protein
MGQTESSPRTEGAEPGDRTIICKDCGGEFTFSAGEARYYQSHGLRAPKRCKPCRAKRRALEESEDR